MKLALVHLSAAACPYRLLDEAGHEIASTPSIFVNSHRARCAPMLMTCCTSPAGSRTRPGLCPGSPSPPCWTMSVINWINSPNPRRKPSIIA